MGAKVIAVSKMMGRILAQIILSKIMIEYAEQVKDITQGKMADVVLNSLGVNIWNSSFESVGVNGRLVTFGVLTGETLN